MEPRPDQRLRRLSIAAISALGVALSCARANAQSAEAEALFNDGDRLMTQGKVAEACDAFEASNRIEARAGTLLRLGECREQNHQLASAWSAYKDALTRAKDPKKQKFATAKVAELEPKLSHLTVTVPAASRLEGLAIARDGKVLDAGLWNRAAPVDGGSYVIAARAPGHDEWQTTVTVPADGGTASIEVPVLKEIAKPVAPPPAPQPQRPPPPPPFQPAATFTTQRKVAVAVGGVGVIAIVTGAILGSSAKGKRDDAYALCPDPMVACARADDANTLIASGHSRAIGADVAFGVGAVALIGAGVLWFTGAGSPERQTALVVVPHVAPSDVGVAVVGRF